ncbi:TfuA-like protein [Streptomyces sp. NBC_01775]|uniref:TfuA-like protein n=1 Tax=Streptomyces sp. NBC_01775 TaxID=2975939 RepID=UPI003FA373C4
MTVREVSRILPTALRYPPVRHGDLLASHACPGDLVLVIDGVFHSAAPVRHKEILWLLARGVAVAGAASMGALRAAELYPYGMRGVGRIFAMYQEGTIDSGSPGTAHGVPREPPPRGSRSRPSFSTSSSTTPTSLPGGGTSSSPGSRGCPNRPSRPDLPSRPSPPSRPHGGP